MFKVGKHEFIVRAPEQVYSHETYDFVDNRNADGGPEYMYFTNVSDIRVEEIHPFIKSANMLKNTRYFDKEKSVFAPWKEDTPTSISSSFEIDWGNTKISKLIKNEADVSSYTDLLITFKLVMTLTPFYYSFNTL